MDSSLKWRVRFGLRGLLLFVTVVAICVMLGIGVYDGMPMRMKINRVFPGMTPAEVEAKLGRPYAVSRSHPSDPPFQVWYYRDNWEVTFDNNKVTSAEQVIATNRGLKVRSLSTK
jgi:outer membrane protein assembly factor BamE (lipoprotein component of BamABCDE complex)